MLFGPQALLVITVKIAPAVGTVRDRMCYVLQMDGFTHAVLPAGLVSLHPMPCMYIAPS